MNKYIYTYQNALNVQYISLSIYIICNILITYKLLEDIQFDK